MEILERALSRVRHGDLPLVEPRWNEDAVAPSRCRRLHLEVAVEVVDRTQNGSRHGLLLLLKAGGNRGDSRLELAPFRERFAGREQR